MLHLSRRRAVGAGVVIVLITSVLTVGGIQTAAADSVTSTQAMRIVSQYTGHWTTPPTVLASGETSDGPLMGNGNVGVVEGGSINNQTFYLGKNDFFSGTSHAIKPVGRIVVAAAGLAGSSYSVVQDIAHAEVRGTYTLGAQTLTTTSWMSATENLFVTSFTLTGGSAQSIGISLQNGAGGTPTVSTTGSELNADVVADTGAASDPKARVAARTIGGTQTISGNKITVTVQPGTTSTLVAGIESSIDTSSYQTAADSLVGTLAATDVSTLNTAHRSWWQTFWGQSFIEIADKSIEKSWYGSLYILGSASRSGQYAPGLWGPWITQANMNWNGDYHTNYNYETPFYAALSTNHVDQAAAYDKPVLDYQANAQTLATTNGFTGVYYPVGISPLGTSADTSLHNQKSNAVNLASNMIMRYEDTHDTTYANTVYPWLKQVGLFWQNYLTWDATNNRYVITNDAPHEDDAYPQTNSSMSLGLVHLLFQGLVDMSTALGVDSTTRTTWQNILSHLSVPATETLNGVTVTRETEVGSAFVNDGNDIAAQYIYPGGLVGLDSTATALSNARNTIAQLTNGWHGGNAPTTFYAAAARVGYNPATILSNLDTEATSNSYNNMAIHHNGGGIENVNVTTSGVDEMLLMSFQNDIKVFADWPTNTNAKFGDLTAAGGFLVSSDVESNAVQYMRVVSQKGGSFTFTNPWPGQTLALYRNGASAGTVSGATITVTSSAGDIIHLAPNGTSYATIISRMALPEGAVQTSNGTLSTGFESGDPQPSWSDTVDTTGGGNVNVTGIAGAPGPEASTRSNETEHAGTTSLMYSGNAGGGSPHAYLKVFDFSASPLPVGASTTLSYWIYPQSNATTPYVAAGSTNSECVAVDLIFTDGSTLRDSGATTSAGVSIHPASQCGHLTLDTWNHITVNLGTHSSGKQINRLLVGYDQPGGSGGYRGYVDDLSIQ